MHEIVKSYIEFIATTLHLKHLILMKACGEGLFSIATLFCVDDKLIILFNELHEDSISEIQTFICIRPLLQSLIELF